MIRVSKLPVVDPLVIPCGGMRRLLQGRQGVLLSPGLRQPLRQDIRDSGGNYGSSVTVGVGRVDVGGLVVLMKNVVVIFYSL